jgi:hypothetical protein
MVCNSLEEGILNERAACVGRELDFKSRENTAFSLLRPVEISDVHPILRGRAMAKHVLFRCPTLMIKGDLLTWKRGKG